MTHPTNAAGTQPNSLLVAAGEQEGIRLFFAGRPIMLEIRDFLLIACCFQVEDAFASSKLKHFIASGYSLTFRWPRTSDLHGALPAARQHE
jgi:hypothetical protein